MAEKTGPGRAETQRRKALARWEDEGGAEPDGPQVPHVGPMPHVEPVTPDAAEGESASAQIDARIAALGDWRGEALARLRALIREADPEIIETVKWRKPTNPMGVPVWEHKGIICTGETYRDKVKLTFAKGASLADPAGLFNASLDGGTRRAIDLFEGDGIDGAALKALIREAVAQNRRKC